jgi:hypothetical protein
LAAIALPPAIAQPQAFTRLEQAVDSDPASIGRQIVEHRIERLFAMAAHAGPFDDDRMTHGSALLKLCRSDLAIGGSC